MKYAYHDLYDDQFESLIVATCQLLFGNGVQGFTKGKDGGKDAKFIGTAENYPSNASPWKGTTIIQAKHTNGFNKSCSDSDFFSPGSKSTIIEKEIPRIKKLREQDEVDNYIIFTNRKLTGLAEKEIVDYLSNNTGLPKECIAIHGIDKIELFMRTYPDIAQIASINPIDSPLIVSPDELAEIIERLAIHKSTIGEVLIAPPTPRVSYEIKNAANKMSPEYAKQLRSKHLADTAVISDFLSAPENDEFRRMYENVVEEFDFEIISKRKDYHCFDDVMEYLFKLLIDRDVVLAKNKILTRTVLFYMYWNCDIGTVDAETK